MLAFSREQGWLWSRNIHVTSCLSLWLLFAAVHNCAESHWELLVMFLCMVAEAQALYSGCHAVGWGVIIAWFYCWQNYDAEKNQLMMLTILVENDHLVSSRDFVQGLSSSVLILLLTSSTDIQLIRLSRVPDQLIGQCNSQPKFKCSFSWNVKSCSLAWACMTDRMFPFLTH